MDFKINKKISALIITLNEEIHIRELLNSLNFVDEIVVVDSFSTDNTKFICESFINVKFYQNRFDNFTSQRNFAIAQAKNDWILFLLSRVLASRSKFLEMQMTEKESSICSLFFCLNLLKFGLSLPSLKLYKWRKMDMIKPTLFL